MNWEKVASFLENYNLSESKDIESFTAGEMEKYADQIQRKRIYAEVSSMLAGAIRAGNDDFDLISKRARLILKGGLNQ